MCHWYGMCTVLKQSVKYVRYFMQTALLQMTHVFINTGKVTMKSLFTTSVETANQKASRKLLIIMLTCNLEPFLVRFTIFYICVAISGVISLPVLSLVLGK